MIHQVGIPNPVMQRVAGDGPMPPEKNTVEVWRGEAVHWYREYLDTRNRLADEIRNSAPRQLDSMIANISTPHAVADATRTVAQLLISGRIDPDKGRIALYALQVCLTALRISAKVAKCGDGRPRPSKRSTPKKGKKR